MAQVHIRRTTGTLASGSLAEAAGGVGAVVLAILGLTQVLPIYMAAIGTIVIGGALFMEGAAIAARYADAMSQLAHTTAGEEVGSGATAESVGGAAGIVLGILALVGVAPLVLMPVALIVFGAALLVGSGVNTGLSSATMLESPADPRVAHALRQAVSAATGAQLLVGLGAIVLGILALLQLAPLILVLAGLLGVGGSILLSGTALTSRIIAPDLEHRRPT